MIEDIQTKIANEQYEFSKHAVDQSIIRQIRLHSYPSRPLVKIITVYEPDPNKWNNDFTVRRKNNE